MHGYKKPILHARSNMIFCLIFCFFTIKTTLFLIHQLICFIILIFDVAIVNIAPRTAHCAVNSLSAEFSLNRLYPCQKYIFPRIVNYYKFIASHSISFLRKHKLNLLSHHTKQFISRAMTLLVIHFFESI